jgi:hypothetical protein
MEPTAPQNAPDSAETLTNGHPEPLESLRHLLLQQERKRIELLEAETEQQITTLKDELTQLEAQLASLTAQVQRGDDTFLPRIEREFPSLTRKAVREHADEMAEAIGPVVGQATRVQIRESPDEFAQALAPIILKTVLTVIRDALRDMQRQIDARLQQTMNSRRVLRTVYARMSGVSASELAMRDALPFRVREAFLIQHNSGLLLAHYSESGDGGDSDLVSGMLTAIRSFVSDSFLHGEDSGDSLDEIGYGNQEIVIRSGPFAYIAVVVEGIEPAGTRSDLYRFITDLHVKYGSEISRYAGDPATIPDFEPQLATLLAGINEHDSAEPTSETGRTERRAVIGAGCLVLLLAVASCFLLWFTIRLLPLAVNGLPTALPPVTVVVTATFTPTILPTETPTHAPTATQTPNPTATPSQTPTPTPTVLPTPTLTATPEPTAIPVTLGNVWTRAEPDFSAELRSPIPLGTNVTIVTTEDVWSFVEWLDVDNIVRSGWVLSRWLDSDSP